ncbi:glycosyltransferase family 2 protein [Algoriphagus sp.]|uniref:glycosyltransferase family 2 protein n=1 Tax=Algoriphagus sp. TaxID=1872435 RepID=UPI00260CDC63|nr:glycosyltransferase family 2 protein [Algoriphagus sp.]
MILAFFVLGILILQYVFLWVYHRFFFKIFENNVEGFPLVSILVAARNEEYHLPKLLDSFAQLNYPSEKIQFLFVDDLSQDATAMILEHWCANRENAKWIKLESKDIFCKSPSPKANALAFLDEHAIGDYLFFTDADCQVPKTWITELLSSFASPIGVVLGITQVSGENWLARLQRMDWWFTLGLVKIASDLGIPTTGLGNNMAIKKTAYLACGGFSEVSDSLTEDLEISRAIQRVGFQIRFQLSPGALVSTKAESSLVSLLAQRKRWMSGAMTLPWYWKLALFFQVLYFPTVIYSFFTCPLLGLVLAVIKMGLQGLFLKQTALKANQSLSTVFALLFDFYFFPLSVLTILYYFWPSATKWKSRRYS